MIEYNAKECRDELCAWPVKLRTYILPFELAPITVVNFSYRTTNCACSKLASRGAHSVPQVPDLGMHEMNLIRCSQ